MKRNYKFHLLCFNINFIQQIAQAKICQESRLYVEVKIVFEANKGPTKGFFLDFHIFCLVIWTGNPGESQTVLCISFICNLCL